MLVITTKVFLFLIIGLALLAAFPDRIRNKAAYRRAVLSCISVFAIYAVGITLLAIVGIPFMAMSNMNGPEDLIRVSWIGVFLAMAWAAVGMSYWSAFRAAVDLGPLRSSESNRRKTTFKERMGAHARRSNSRRRTQTTVYRANGGQVTESAHTDA